MPCLAGLPDDLEVSSMAQSEAARCNREVPMTDDYRRKRNTAGGVAVILATGLAALGEATFFDGSFANTFLAVLTFGLVLGGAFALWRFVARHGDEIGEARFDTRNKDEHP
jgi:hypothetical protein